MERVAEASALPLLLFGGDAGDRPDEMFTRWQKAVQLLACAAWSPGATCSTRRPPSTPR
jgi:hypothetical protein